MESVTLTANLITSLAFQRFSEKLSESQIASRNQLRQKIWDKFRNNPKAENAIIAAERDSQSDLEPIAAYLQVAMYEDPQFADEIQAIVQELIDTQGEIPLNAKDIQARGNQIIVSASGGALIGSLLAGVPG
ncbi:MAG TPA: hypothetical protein DCL61_11090, partial [Cyanobacteria bacterium UBA12227]|nr:hypothetical protein [Cyanobacteria bacterium UBA12227]